MYYDDKKNDNHHQKSAHCDESPIHVISSKMPVAAMCTCNLAVLCPESETKATLERNKAMHEIVVKKSRFIAYAAKIDSEDKAKAYIADISQQHKKARHVVFAYALPNIARYSDDGEPHGTAGLPLLSSIQRRNMENVSVVVVRYFGGILLGKGGLIRAYGKAAGAALEALLKERK